DETRHSLERVGSLKEKNLISPETYDQAASAFQTAKAQFEVLGIQLGYTEIRAPFDGLIVDRYVDFAQQASAGMPLFRISDFDPLLCPIQVPEREMLRIRVGQAAYLTVGPYPEKKFEASVLRISPVVDAGTGTFKVTLQVKAQRLLRPGMFARVYLKTETRPDVLVIPKSSLSLDSIGDSVYVVEGGKASRRAVTLGFKEGDRVEVVSGVTEKQKVVVVGQDGLSDGTPVRILAGDEDLERSHPEKRAEDVSPQGSATPKGVAAHESQGRGHAGLDRRGERQLDFSKMSPEQLKQVRRAMRAMGVSEKEIEERMKRTGATPPLPGSMSRP
ncbi:MAG: efflux RND transporter periplasmic adaptor subunit, partial [Acidobacteriota bacterium]